jgi:uncharacterized YigZ family protein
MTYTTVEKNATAEFEEKRSLFLGHACHAETEEEALAFIKSKQSEFRDATHNVWAYYMKNGVLARYSDDGEPTGTAGLPSLEAIRKSGVHDVCVVVTRYFGGILLGAGGLVRAYSKATSLAIEAAVVVTYEPFAELEANCNYSDYQKVLNELSKYGARVDSTDFSDSVKICIAVKEGLADNLAVRMSELTAARVIFKKTGTRLDK